MGNSKETVSLKKGLSGRSLIAIGLGAIVGWSWVVYGGMWSTLGGSLGGIIGFAITGVLCSLVGLVYAEMTSAFPKAGGDVVFALEGIGQTGSIIMMWLVVMFWVGLTMIETMFFPVILTRLGVPIPEWGAMYTIAGGTVYLSYFLISLGMNALIAFLNSRSVEISGKIQQAAVYILLIAALILCFGGIIKGNTGNMEPLFTTSAGFFAVMLMLPGFMSGFNAIPQAAEEASVPRRIIGRAVILTVWAAVLFYVMIILGTALGGDYAMRSGDGLVVLDVVYNLFGGSALVIFFVTFASLLGMLTTCNACYIAGTRLFVGLSRAKYLPKSIAYVNPKTKAPTKSILMLFITSSLIIFFGANTLIYVTIIDVFSFALVIAWGLVVVSFLRLQKLRPEMERPYKVKYPKLVGWAALIFSLAFLYLYTPFGPAGLTGIEWTVVGIIVLIALIVYFAYNRRKGYVSLEERRSLMGLTETNTDVEEPAGEK
jgi:APA family basic amino acid/polyamine antiporter